MKQLYKVKLAENHTASNEQHDKGYLYDPWLKEPATYTRGEAIKKARMFGGKIEVVENHKVYSPFIVDNSHDMVFDYLAENYGDDVPENIKVEIAGRIAPKLIEVLEQILPYAENEIAAIQDVGNKDDDYLTQQEYEKASQILDKVYATIKDSKGGIIK